MKYKEIQTSQELNELINTSEEIIEFTAFQSLNIVKYEDNVLLKQFNECIFLGCNLNEKIKKHIGFCGEIMQKR